MQVFRLSRKKYADVLSGKGAAIRGARWNSKGTEVIYTAENRSLAMAEVLIHLSMMISPPDYVMLIIEIPDELPVLEISEKDLPGRWNSFPWQRTTQRFGDEFIYRQEFCIMKVPSVVTRGEFNILIQPHHPDFSRIKIVDATDFPFDHRLLF